MRLQWIRDLLRRQCLGRATYSFNGETWTLSAEEAEAAMRPALKKMDEAFDEMEKSFERLRKAPPKRPSSG